MNRPLAVLCGAVLLAAVSPASGVQESSLVQPAEWWQVHPRPVYELLREVGTFQEWFDVYELAAGTYAIYEPRQFEEAISYLVLGKERAALIDTGTGIGNIDEVVAALTELPTVVVLTHEHYDHVAGAHRFEEIIAYDDAASLSVLRAGRDNASLQRYVTEDDLWKALPEGFDPKAWEIPPLEPTRLVQDGDVIELGERTLEVLYTPGHSPGSMCLLDEKHRLLFTGDHFYAGPLYAFSADVTIDDYVASNAKLSSRIAEYDHVCGGHNDPWVTSDVIPRVSRAFESVLSGAGEFSEDDGLRRYHFQGFDILIRAALVTNR